MRKWLSLLKGKLWLCQQFCNVNQSFFSSWALVQIGESKNKSIIINIDLYEMLIAWYNFKLWCPALVSLMNKIIGSIRTEKHIPSVKAWSAFYIFLCECELAWMHSTFKAFLRFMVNNKKFANISLNTTTITNCNAFIVFIWV